jgi:hypothetical protein
MRRIALYSCLAATLLLSSACKNCTPGPTVCTPPASYSLAVPLRGQETNVWCWAATTEMCLDFLGTNVSQCDCANKYTSRSDCCNSPTPGPCVTTGWPVFGAYGYTFSQTSNTALSFDQIKDQTYCKKKPVAFIWWWTGGGGHIMVAKGYKTQGGTNYVHMNDPWPPNVGTISYITYAHYVSQAGSHTHGDDFYNLTK